MRSEKYDEYAYDARQDEILEYKLRSDYDYFQQYFSEYYETLEELANIDSEEASEKFYEILLKVGELEEHYGWVIEV